MGLLSKIWSTFSSRTLGSEREIRTSGRGSIRGRYDAAQDTPEFMRHWEAADDNSADAANSFEVRRKLVPRSRYEHSNNGYAAGIAKTYADDLIGTGPKLRMQTGSENFNNMIERVWMEWAKSIQLRRKLWTMCHAKYVDGEGIGVIRTNPGVAHPILLDVVLYETEQLHTPELPYNLRRGDGYTDGIKYDEFGNPEWYDFLPYHPYSDQINWLAYESERVRPEFVLHWFKCTRPGQHRGIPEATSTLNVGAAARRWREAVLACAETAADFTALLKTELPPGEQDDAKAYTQVPIEKRMLTALPMGWEMQQMRAEQPMTTHAEFSKALINEMARPLSMPYNKAACDSSSYNYASGRLDHQTYYAGLDVERADGDDLVLDPLFRIWFDEAVRVYGWLGGDPRALSPTASAHTWDWPRHQVADVKVEADAVDKRLKNGSLSPYTYFTEQGQDPEEELEKTAQFYGIAVDELRTILLQQNLYDNVQMTVGPDGEPTEEGTSNESEEETTEE